MRINTKTDTLEVTKPEQAILDKAADLAAKIAKHAGGPLQEAGEAARDRMLALNSILKNGIPELSAVTPPNPLKAVS